MVTAEVDDNMVVALAGNPAFQFAYGLPRAAIGAVLNALPLGMSGWQKLFGAPPAADGLMGGGLWTASMTRKLLWPLPGMNATVG
jgi:hypothetical protein